MIELADKSYLAVKAESVENTPVKPNVFLPLESESVVSELNLTADRRMYGNDWETNDLSAGERTHRGSLKVWGDPNSIGYILDMCLQYGSPSGSAPNGYTHPFTPGDPQSYTIEIPRGAYAFRYFGVKGSELKLSFDESKLKAELEIAAVGQFSGARTRDALTGASSTTVVFTQDYDLEPTRGLIVGDILTIIDVADPTDTEDVTIQAVEADGVTLTLTGAVTNSHLAGVMVALKAQTPSFGTYAKPFFFGDLLVGFGATASAAETAAAAKSTATPSQAVEVTYSNNLMNVPFSNYRDNYKLLARQKSIVLTMKQMFVDITQRAKWLEITKQGISLILRGELIKLTATTTRNQLKITLHKAKLETNNDPLEVGEYIFDEQTFRGAYDSSDTKAITVELVNTLSTY